MFQLEENGGSFYIYAMELFSKAGHVFTPLPEVINHSPEQFCYFDNKSNVVLSRDQRAMFQVFNDISRLFSFSGCVFLSINLLVARNKRSQAAHDIHTMIHPIIGVDGTICLFRYNDEVMLSFVGFGYNCILSDWYPMADDDEQLLARLDIANMSIERDVDYFIDMVYSLARSYYLYKQPSPYEILPIDFISNAGIDGVDGDELSSFIEHTLTYQQRKYGDDYVEYDKSITVKEDISAELDLMLLAMEDEDDNPFDEDDNPFDEEIEPEDDILDEDKFYDDNAEPSEMDKYEFYDVDPEIFCDPTLMVKWLNKMEHQHSDFFCNYTRIGN